MNRVLAISPHLDDAIFSAGGTLAAHAMAGDAVTVVTCFTGNVPQPTGFALACQLDKGLDRAVDYMAIRRAEDEAACAAIGAEAVHLPFLEAPHRGYESAAALFDAPLATDTITAQLLEALADMIARHVPDVVYGPFGIGGHVDHLLVRAAMEQLRTRAPIIWWEDYPYAMRERQPPAGMIRRPLGPEPATRKLAATLAYESQLGFQFGGASAARRALAHWLVEGFTAASATAAA